jgi:peptidyl-prolyl cis-trans isomerase SurA
MTIKKAHQWLFAVATFSALSMAQAQGIKAPQGTPPAGKLSAGLGAANNTGTGTAPIDGIVAVVNSDIITRRELNRQVALIERQMSKRGAPLPNRDELRKQVLDRMVMDRAQLQKAEQVGIRIEEAQIEAAMARVAEQNGLSLEDFLKRLQEEGVSPARFREEVRSEITLGRLREREVESRIQVSDAEIQNYLAARVKGGTAANQPEVNWIQLLIKVPADATGTTLSQARAKVEAVEKALKEGKTVEAILQANPALSVDGTGQMGWSAFDAVPSLFTDFLSKGQPNAVQTVRSPNGFHVLKVVDRREGGAALDATPVVQTRARHILIRPGPDISDAEARRRLSFALEQLKGGAATFDALAKRYSQDGSAAKGGDLGWLYPGDTVPEFEREMNQLSPGGVSPVFQSRFGFHIIQVDERRQQAASEERQRQAARQAIRNNKSEESYQEWLRQLRDSTFVDIRL